MNLIKKLFVPNQATMDRVWGHVSKRTLWIWRVVVLVILAAWFGLGYYLHTQAKQSQARLEQKRMEASRREEAARRQAIYQQEVEQYKKYSRQQNRLYGQ